MRFYWYGHACFLIVTAGGTRVLTDPFDATVGYSLPREPVDVVTVSHHHYDHDAAGEIKGHPRVVDSADKVQVKDVSIYGVSSYHDNTGGRQRGANTIFVIEADGLRSVHLGDLGHQLSPAQVRDIGEVDVLMVPVGGTFTVDAAGAAGVVNALHPQVILPMHYQTPWLQNLRLDPVEKFTALFSAVRRASDLEISRESLPGRPEVVVLEVYQEQG